MKRDVSVRRGIGYPFFGHVKLSSRKGFDIAANSISSWFVTMMAIASVVSSATRIAVGGVCDRPSDVGRAHRAAIARPRRSGVAGEGEEPACTRVTMARETYPALERYRKLARIDEERVWSVVCFFIDARARRQGLMLGLLNAAVAYALSRGARIVEGYPVEPGRIYAYMGSPATFRRAGFHDVTPTGRERTVFRLESHLADFTRTRLPR